MQYFLAPFAALRYIYQNRQLWKFVSIPVGITLVVYVLSYRFILGWVQDVFRDFFGTSGWVLALYVIVTLGLLLLTFYTFTIFLNIIAAPFNELLSEKVEDAYRRTKGQDTQKQSIRMLLREYGRTIAAEITRLLVFGAITLGLMLLSFAFSGGLLLPALGGIVAVFFLAFEFLDYAMARHALSFQEKMRSIWRNRTPFFLYGVGLMVFFAIPVFNILFVPAAVVSATQLFLQTKGK